MLTPAKIAALKSQLPTMSPEEKLRVLDLLAEYEKRKQMGDARGSFTSFIKHVYPHYKFGAHHKKLISLFEAVARGEKKRIIVNIAPRHGKSELISYLAPAWFLGNFPEKKVIMASHTADLAVDFGRKVRNLVGESAYKQVFPDVALQQDSKSASRWGTNHKGEYFAIGVGGALAGRGADLFIIDDPHSEQEAKQGKPEVFKPPWEWFQSGPLQRLMPGGAIIVVMCMTGDTPVLMADGSTTELRNVHPGDDVATYEDGKITTAKVLNHRSNGVDSVYTVRTQSGIIVRANTRHPFLVEANGERKWTRLQDLKPGMSLVVTKDVNAQPVPKQSRVFVTPAKPEPLTTERTQTRLTNPSVTTGSGKVKAAPKKNVQNPQKLTGFVNRITTSGAGLRDIGATTTPLNTGGQSGLKAGTGSRRRSSVEWLKSVVTAAMSVVNRHLTLTPVPIGTASSVSTTATTRVPSGGCSVTTATLLSDTEKPQKSCNGPLSTYAVTTDQIVSIDFSGREEVFDVQIERTENFIANGVVSHNTRWSKLDLTGQLIDHMTRNPDADQWEVVELPAILNENTDEEKPLWPDFWTLDELLAKKAGMDPRYWQAQYMQQPTSEEGALIKREWWNVWEEEKPPRCDFTIMSLDAAQEATNRSDFNSLTVWGVFDNEESGVKNIILLESIRERMEFPELKKMVLENYKEWEPDSFIVEKKSNGAALYQELRSMGVPVSEFTPGKGQDKIARVNAVSDLFSSGMVWAPDTRWSRELIEEVASFPFGTHDDMVDSTTQALLRFRQGGFIALPSDEPEDVRWFRSKRRGGFY